MTEKIKILAISGSTKKASSNLNLIMAIASLASDSFVVNIFEGLAELPHFNPDLDYENVPQQVISFRQQLREADGILICSPEYALGVPGALKNAVDWTVSSMDFSGKPVALITASLSGLQAHKSILGTLLILEARITAETQLLISFVKSNVSSDCKITETETLNCVLKLIRSLIKIIRNENEVLLPAPILMNEGIPGTKT
jgi:chromate reductase